jgi:hypothetical protein
MNIPIAIQLKQLWGTETFTKSEWGNINLIVGPNGTGKSLFADQLKEQLNVQGIKTRLLNAERLAGLEKQDYAGFTGMFDHGNGFKKGFNISNFEDLKANGANYGLSSSAFVILKERLDIRIKIEALLSDIFQKTIRLVEEGGFLNPKIQNINGGVEYGLKEQECHGLKELLTLLTILYDENYNCLILDEPELHLHPQFQSFLLSEIRKLAGNPKVNPSKKLFFIITHSPYFLDFRSLEDLKSVLVCHYNSLPTFIQSLESQDEYILKRFLPRFNTHHKQFFFSPNPVFVEGYTDQQIISLLFDKLDLNISASGSCIVDVGGKDELGVFFRLCKKLQLGARIVADLDALFKGKLREVAQQQEACNKFIQDKGLGTDVSSLIGELERKLKQIADDLIQKNSTDSDISNLIENLKSKSTDPDQKHKVIISVALAVQKFKDKILATSNTTQHTTINFVIPRLQILIEAFESINIFILPKGELEHYYTKSVVDYLNVTNKDTYFHTERDFILSCMDIETLETSYSELIPVLKKSIPLVKVDLSKHVKYKIVEWIQSVQIAVSKGEVTDTETLKSNAKVDYKLFSQIIEIVGDLQIQEDKRFKCKIKISSSLTYEDIQIEFDEKTIPHEFKLSI